MDNDYPGIAGFEDEPTLSIVREGHLCQGCAYPLVGETIRRDPRTGLPLVCCPECGRYYSAHALADDLGERERRQTMLSCHSHIAGVCFATFLLYILTWIMWGLMNGALSEWGDRGLARWVSVGVIAGCVPAVVWFAATVLADLLMPHWRRRRVGVVMIGLAVLFATLPLPIAEINRYHGPSFPMWQLAASLIVFVAALIGVSVVYLTIPHATRGLAKAMLAPPLRAPMAYLWVRDGLKPPAGSREKLRLSDSQTPRPGAAQ